MELPIGGMFVTQRLSVKVGDVAEDKKVDTWSQVEQILSETKG